MKNKIIFNFPSVSSTIEAVDFILENFSNDEIVEIKIKNGKKLVVYYIFENISFDRKMLFRDKMQYLISNKTLAINNTNFYVF